MKTEETTQVHGIQRWRFALVLLAFAALMGVIFARLIMLHTVEQSFLSWEGEKRSVRSETQYASRGMITDRYGQPLAVSTPVTNLWVNPRQVSDFDGLARVARELGYHPEKLVGDVTKAARQGRAFMYLKRQADPALTEKVMAHKVKGVHGEDDFRRFYPAAEVTAQTVGIVNIDGQGQEGVELAFDQYLHGKDGKRSIVQDASANVIKQLSVESVVEAGKDLQLTIDLRLQYLAYRELKAAVQTHNAKAGSAVMLDAKTGEILAMVSQPSYNPNNRASLKPAHMRNRVVTDLVEPGSTIKPFTVAAALESGKYTPDTVIDTSPGIIRVGWKNISDHRDYGLLDVTGVITKSSNVGTTLISRELGAQSMWEFLTSAGFGQSTMTGFPGEAVGQLPYPEEMKDVTLATVSYGYGLAVSPLQLAEAYTSFVDGCRKPAIMLLNQEGQDCVPVMSSESARQVLDMMETVVSAKGTGRRAAVEGYRVGGKTGTAHKVGRRGYEEDEYTAAFAGVAPLTDPELVLVVVVDQPQGKEYYGGEVAAPVFSRIMQQALRLRQVIPDKPAENQILHLAGRGQ